MQNVYFFVKIYVWITHDYEWDQASIYENQIKLKRFTQQIIEPCTLHVFIKYHSLDNIAFRALDFNSYIFVSQIKKMCRTRIKELSLHTVSVVLIKTCSLCNNILGRKKMNNPVILQNSFN